MRFVKSESRQAPQAVEKISGGRYLVRRNITKEVRTGTDGQEVEVFVYDEAVADVAEYAAYAAVEAAELKRESDIVDEYTLQLIDEGVL